MPGLFGGRREPAQPGPTIENADTLIGPSTAINGSLRSDGNLYVEGLVEGAVECAGTLHIGPGGRVLASVTARHILIDGSLKGNCDVSGGLRITPSGKLWGDILVGALLIDDGGLFRGQCTMRDELNAAQ